MSDPFKEFDGGSAPAAPVVTAPDAGHTQTPQPATWHGPQGTPKSASAAAEELTRLLSWDGSPPTSYKESIRLRMAMPKNANSEAGAAELARRRKVLADYAATMENGPMLKDHVPAIKNREMHTARPLSRAARIAALESAIAAGALDKPLVIRADCHMLIAGVFMSEGVEGNAPRHFAAELRGQLAAYWLSYEKAFQLLNPEDRASELRLALSQPQDAEQTEKLRAELIFLDTPAPSGELSAARLIAQTTSARLLAEFQPIKENLELLTFAIAEGLREHQKIAVAAEIKFFHENGVPHQKTEISQRYTKLITDLEATRERASKIEAQHISNFPPHPSHIAGSLWGVEILPGLA